MEVEASPVDGCALAVPRLVDHRLEGDCPQQMGAPLGPLLLSPSQRSGFATAPDGSSPNPCYDQIVADLDTVLRGAVAYYESGLPGACRFPPDTAYWFPEGCRACGTDEYTGVVLDLDGDGLCDPDGPLWDDDARDLFGFRSAPPSPGYGLETRELRPRGLTFCAQAAVDRDYDGVSATHTRIAVAVPDVTCRAAIVSGIRVEYEDE